jgi:hypothetical protein
MDAILEQQISDRRALAAAQDRTDAYLDELRGELAPRPIGKFEETFLQAKPEERRILNNLRALDRSTSQEDPERWDGQS